jgi:hypothetical protein
MQVSLTEVYEIESEIPLTEQELLWRAVNRDNPDDVQGNGDTPYTVSVLKGKMEVDESLND